MSKSPSLEQRPAAMRALDPAQIGGDLGFERGIDGLARDNAAAAHIRPGWWRRLRARTGNGRRRAGTRAAPASPASICRSRSNSLMDALFMRQMHLNRGFGQRDRRRDCRSGSRLRWSRASRYLVQSPASTRLRHAVSAPGRFASCSGVAAKVARRSRTICQGGSAAGNPVTRRDVGPNGLRQLFARRVDQPVAGADRHRQPAGKSEDPFHRAIDDAEDRRLPAAADRYGNAH